MKKIIAILLVIAMSFSISGCGPLPTVNAVSESNAVETESEQEGLGDLVVNVFSHIVANWIENKIEQVSQVSQENESH